MRSIKICQVILASLWAASAAAQNYRNFEGPLNPLESRLFADALDGKLDEHSLLAAALVASGVENASEVRSYEKRLADWCDQLTRSGLVTGTIRQRAQAVFEFMHERILTSGYSQDCTDLRTTLDQGRFNCVSATVLFNCLAERFGLQVCGVEMRGHAMSRLMTEDGPLDIETTCSRWFVSPAATKESQPKESQNESQQRREVAGPQLAAMIFYNRGVDLLTSQQFTAALSANAKALRLDPQSDTARGNLLATLNNWAIALGVAGHYSEAVARLEQGMTLDSHYATFVANYAYVHYQWVESLCREGRFHEAESVVNHALQQQPNLPYLRQAAAEIHRRSGN